jgi:hypothetical protein
MVNRLLKAVPLLKAWAKDPNQPATRIADSVGLSSRNYVYNYIIRDFVNLYDTAIKQEDFPSNLLIFYNQHGSNLPEHILKPAEVHALKPVYEREKERITSKLQQRSQTFMYNPNFATGIGTITGTRPAHTAMLNPTTTTRGQTPNMGANATLISLIMENIRMVPLRQLPKFLRIFEQAEAFYMTHPVELEELFKSQFGPMPGTVGFRQFMITQPYYVYNAPHPGSSGGYASFAGSSG